MGRLRPCATFRRILFTRSAKAVEFGEKWRCPLCGRAEGRFDFRGSMSVIAIFRQRAPETTFNFRRIASQWPGGDLRLGDQAALVAGEEISVPRPPTHLVIPLRMRLQSSSDTRQRVPM